MPTTPYTGSSIVDYLGSQGQANSYAARAALAASKGITGYAGTADQNTQLLNMLRGSATPTTPTVPTTPTAPVGGSTPTIPSTLYGPNGASATSSGATTPAQYQAALASGWSAMPPASSTPTTPTVPTNAGNGFVNASGNYVPPTGTGSTGSGATDPTATSNTMLQNVLALMTPSSNELGLQSTLAAQEASRRQSVLDINNQPIATPFQTGQAAAVTSAANAGEANTQGALTIAQNQRLASLDAAKTALDFSKPTTVGLGTNLVSPLTGQTVAEGQSYAGKQGSANVLALSKMYPDAGILPTDDPNVAAQKASNAPSFIAKYGKVNYQWDPNTGQFVMLSTSRLGTTSPGASYSGNPNGTGTNFGTAGGSAPVSSGNAGIGGGSITDYLNSIGKDSSFSARATIAQNAGMQNYTGTAQQNTQLLSMLRQAGGNSGGSATGGMSSVPIGASGGAAPAGGATASTAVTGNSPFGLNLSNKIDSAALSYIQTGDMPSGIYPADQAAVRAKAQAAVPGFNPAIAKANASAIADQTKTLTNVSAAIRTADDNFNLLVNTVQKAGINDNSSPIVNGIQNAIQKGVIGNGELNQFNTGIQTLRTEYAMVLARGGEVTDSVRTQANALIPDNISLANLQKVFAYIKAEGANVIGERQSAIQQLSSGGGTAPGSSAGAQYQSPSGKTYTLPY